MADPRVGRSNLPELLRRANLTQTQFAKKMKMSDAMVTKIINGKKVFSLGRARQASIVLDCRMEELHVWNDF